MPQEGNNNIQAKTNHSKHLDHTKDINEIEAKIKNVTSSKNSSSKYNTNNYNYELGSYQGGGGNIDRISTTDRDEHDRFPNNSVRYDYENHERRKGRFGKNNNDYYHILDCNNFDAYGSIDVELMMMQSPQDENQDKQDQGIHIHPIRNQMNFFCYIPPKYGSNTFASFSGKTGILHRRGFTDTTLSLGYQFLGGNAILYDWHTQDGTSKISYGLSHSSSSKRCTYTEAKIYYPSTSFIANRFQNTDNNDNNPSIEIKSSTDIVPDKLRGRMEVRIDHSSLHYIKLGLGTIHQEQDQISMIQKSNNQSSPKPHLQLELNLLTNRYQNWNDPSFPLKLEYKQPHYSNDNSTATPKISSQTEISISTNNIILQLFQSPKYQFQLLFTRFISRFSTFSTGIQLDSFQGLSWLFRWKKGDVSFNVPINLSSIVLGGKGNNIVSNASTTTSRSSHLLYYLSSSYIGFLSFVIDAIVGDITQRGVVKLLTISPDEPDLDNHQYNNQSTLEKEKKDAELQIQLMKRKALTNKKNEDEKGGLVIVDAKYGCQLGHNRDNDKDALDVSIPLQFWVSDSRLVLSSNPKSQMLGFYDVTRKSTSRKVNSKSSSTGGDVNSGSKKNKSGLLLLWESLFDKKADEINDKQEAEQIPTLSIRYKFNGILYDICVRDNESVTIPSPRALKIT